jgi:hypothetical protein
MLIINKINNINGQNKCQNKSSSGIYIMYNLKNEKQMLSFASLIFDVSN